MTQSENTPDPVLATAPDAPPAPDDEHSDEYLESETGAVPPIAGAQAGTVPVVRPVSGNG